LLYINDLTKITNNKDNNIKSKLILFADDTSLIVTNPNSTDFIKDIIMTIKNINLQFKTNLLSLNPNKTNFMNFITKNSSCIDGNLGYDDTLISNTSILKFFWLITDDTLTWISYVEIIASKSNAACFAVTLVKPYMTCDTFKIIHYSYFHSIMNYGLIFWGKFLMQQ
jgi:hypothetical protein